MTAPDLTCDCGNPVEVDPCDGGVILWHACTDYSLGLKARDMAHVRELWTAERQRRARA